MIAFVRLYDSLGWQLVPVAMNSKAPTEAGWQHRVPDLAAIERHLAAAGNVGVLLGPASRELVDTDLDCPEALALAPLYPPATGAIFGRPAKPCSHRLYTAPGSVFASFADPTDGSTLLELRAPGRDGGGHQTLLPPSIASDELRFWHGEPIEPAAVEAGVLSRRAAWLAIGVLVMRHISEYTARRPGLDLIDLLWEYDPEKLGRKAYHWAGERAPDERPPDVKPRRQYTGDELRLEEVCAAITNDFDWHGWNSAGMAIWAASGGSQLGFVCFDDLSARSPKYQPHSVRERWKNYGRYPPSHIGIGSLVRLAQQSGWRRRAAR